MIKIYANNLRNTIKRKVEVKLNLDANKRLMPEVQNSTRRYVY